jgi:hypothetical protein
LIDDQIPRGARCDETMATTGETAALAVLASVPWGIMFAGKKARTCVACQAPASGFENSRLE